MTGYIFDQISGDRAFWLCDGRKIESIRSLYEEMDSINDEIFKYHVNENKNDFSAWIKEVFNEIQLADEISKLSDRKSVKAVLRDWISNIIHENHRKIDSLDEEAKNLGAFFNLVEVKSGGITDSDENNGASMANNKVDSSSDNNPEFNVVKNNNESKTTYNKSEEKTKPMNLLASVIDFILGFLAGALVMLLILKIF